MNEVIEEYYPEYCHSLEAVYGKGMMSEGGREAIDFMFKDLFINNPTCPLSSLRRELR